MMWAPCAYCGHVVHFPWPDAFGSFHCRKCGGYTSLNLDDDGESEV